MASEKTVTVVCKSLGADWGMAAEKCNRKVGGTESERRLIGGTDRRLAMKDNKKGEAFFCGIVFVYSMVDRSGIGVLLCKCERIGSVKSRVRDTMPFSSCKSGISLSGSVGNYS